MGTLPPRSLCARASLGMNCSGLPVVHAGEEGFREKRGQFLLAALFSGFNLAHLALEIESEFLVDRVMTSDSDIGADDFGCCTRRRILTKFSIRVGSIRSSISTRRAGPRPSTDRSMKDRIGCVGRCRLASPGSRAMRRT